jgi:hypothetical protein
LLPGLLLRVPLAWGSGPLPPMLLPLRAWGSMLLRHSCVDLHISATCRVMAKHSG